MGAARSTTKNGIRDLGSRPWGRTWRVGCGRVGRTEEGRGARPRAGAAGARGLVDRAGARWTPESSLRWTTKSTRNLARELTALGHAVATPWSLRSCGPAGTACRATARPWKDASTPTGDACYVVFESLRWCGAVAGSYGRLAARTVTGQPSAIQPGLQHPHD
jgi:hypothetical protein